MPFDLKVFARSFLLVQPLIALRWPPRALLPAAVKLADVAAFVADFTTPHVRTADPGNRMGPGR